MRSIYFLTADAAPNIDAPSMLEDNDITIATLIAIGCGDGVTIHNIG